jgi:citrate lyase gamma subunit
MKKSITGLVVVGCIVIGSIAFASGNNDSKESSPSPIAENQQIDTQKVNKEMATLTMAIMGSLKGFDVVGDIQSNYLESITVQTSLHSSDPNSNNVAKEIQETVEEVLASKEFESYKVYVEDKNGEIIHTQTEDEEITVSHKGIEDQENL